MLEGRRQIPKNRAGGAPPALCNWDGGLDVGTRCSVQEHHPAVIAINKGCKGSPGGSWGFPALPGPHVKASSEFLKAEFDTGQHSVGLGWEEQVWLCHSSNRTKALH